MGKRIDKFRKKIAEKKENNRAHKVAGVSGLLCAITLVTTIAVSVAMSSNSVTPWFSWTNNALSHLGTCTDFPEQLQGPVPSRYVFNIGLMIVGGLGIVFATSYIRATGNTGVQIGLVFYAIACSLISFVGIFCLYHPYHDYVAVTAFALIPISLIIIAISYLVGNRRVFFWITISLATIISIAAIVAASNMAQSAIPEFVVVVTTSLWMIIIAIIHLIPIYRNRL